MEDTAIAEDLDPDTTNLDILLQNDPSFLDFFNAFLALGSFPRRLFYNKKHQYFEEFVKTVATDDIQQTTLWSFHDEEKRQAKIKYTIRVLDPAQGYDWVCKHRLPLFLLSDFYIDYKLARWLAVVQMEYFHRIEGQTDPANVKAGHAHPEDHLNNVLSFVPILRPKMKNRKISCNIVYDTDPVSMTTAGTAGVDQWLQELPETENLTEEDDGLKVERNTTERHCSSENAADSALPPWMTACRDNNGICDPEEIDKEMSNKITCGKCPFDSGMADEGLRQSQVSKENTDQSSSVITTCNNWTHGIDPLPISHHSVSYAAECPQQMGSLNRQVLHCPITNQGVSDAATPSSSTHTSSLTAVNEACPKKQVKRKQTLLMSELGNQLDDTGASKTPECAHWLKKLDLSTKHGISCFKEFICGTVGEKCLKLWADIERLKSMDGKRAQSHVSMIRQMYLATGAAFELPHHIKQRLRSYSLECITQDQLFSQQDTFINPSLSYWCARYTLHIRERIHNGQGTEESILPGHTSSLGHPAIQNAYAIRQRPHSSAPYCKAERKQGVEFTQLCTDDSTTESSITKKKIRSKSANPRITATPDTQDTNAGYEQLKLLTTIPRDVNGFHQPRVSCYSNNAANGDASYMEGVRLFVKPMPPFNCSSFAVKRQITKPIESDGATLNRQCDVVDVLLYECFSGDFFSSFITERQNKVWQNALECWKKIQDYTLHFYSTNFNPQLVMRKAQAIYAEFVSPGCHQSVQLSEEPMKRIMAQLSPPFEDLFDDLENHSIGILSRVWEQLKRIENIHYDTLIKEEKQKLICIERKMKSIPKNSIASDESHDVAEVVSPDNKEEGLSAGKISTKLVGKKPPIPEDGITLESLLQNKKLLDPFIKFLEINYMQGFKDYNAWVDMETFRSYDANDSVKHEHAKTVKRKWLGKSYFFGNDSPATELGQQQVLRLAGKDVNEPHDLPPRPPSPVILRAQQYVRTRLELYYLPLYKGTKEYNLDVRGKKRVGDMVEDIIMRRRMQRNETACKLLNSKRASNSQEVNALRAALSTQETRETFRKFVSLKGDLVENDVDFWMEIQKFKNLCHNHLDESLTRKKIQTIIDVFIKSSIPPELRVTIPIEIAERLYDRACGRLPNHGPYLFRESQAAIFQCLLGHWKEYVEFCSNRDVGDITQEVNLLLEKEDTKIKERKLNAERKRLFKLTSEKKRKEKERHTKSKHQDTMSVISESAATVTTATMDQQMEARPFSYSKLLADDHLKSLEQQMLSKGMTLENYAESASRHHASRKRSGFTGLSRRYSIQSEVSRASHRTFMTESCTPSIISNSSRKISKSNQDSMKPQQKLHRGSPSVVDQKGTKDSAQQDLLLSNRKTSTCRKSSIVPLQVKGNGRLVLTKTSLEEFEKKTERKVEMISHKERLGKLELPTNTKEPKSFLNQRTAAHLKKLRQKEIKAPESTPLQARINKPSNDTAVAVTVS